LIIGRYFVSVVVGAKLSYLLGSAHARVRWSDDVPEANHLNLNAEALFELAVRRDVAVEDFPSFVAAALFPGARGC
jgi:hypothetical protein